MQDQPAGSDQPYAYRSLDDQPPPQAEKPRDYGLAGRGRRLGASLIDDLIALGLSFAITFLFTGFLFKPGTTAHDDGLLSSLFGLTLHLDDWWLSLINVALYLGLQSVFYHMSSQSIGKYALGIAIYRNDKPERASLKQILLLRTMPRLLVPYIPVVGNFILFVDTCFIFRKDRRCIHDLIANTRVVDIRP